MRMMTLIAMSAMSIAAAAPAVAQDAMMNHSTPSGSMMNHSTPAGSMMRMSAADQRRMRACNAMPHARMMKNARCARMMKMHPDMMHHGAMNAGN